VAAALVVLLNRGSSPAPKTAASGATSRSHTSASGATSRSHTSASRPASTPQATGAPSGSATSTSPASAPAASSTTAAGTTAPPATPPSSSSSSASGSRAAAPSSSASAASPVAAVESFYRLATARRYPDAWALADPAFRAQLGGYRSFQAGQANDRSITFDSARVVSQTGNSSTVTVSTTSVQADGTRHCSGTVDLLPGTRGHWLLHQIHINCS
jgi:hypothetical protein